MNCAFPCRAVAGVLLLLLVPAAGAQSLDVRLFGAIYAIETPGFTRTMRAADAAAFPGIVGTTAVAWTAAAVSGDPWDDAYALSLSQAGALAGTVALKFVVRRPRPYVRLPGVEARTERLFWFDPYAFPSAHAALAFATVTSLSLLYPRWYVVVPGYVWASAVSVSRVWLGVHYPADVLGGALLGGAVAWGVHRLGARLVPGFLEREAAAPVVRLRFRL